MIGKTISHYTILEKLGEGGMGVVYRAQDTRLDRMIALKFLPPELTRDSEAKGRFIHEAKAAAALSHPNICTVHEIDEADGQIFIATECIEGKTLKEKIATGPMKIDEALSTVIQVAEGLQEAHEGGIVHRDIKSANVMVTPKGQAKIMDFGLAKLAGGTKLTKTGTTVGTIAYMSPEQARAEEVDERSDVWSLGVVLYEMLTGQLPFRGDYNEAVVYSILNEVPEPVTALRTGVPMELERVVGKALEKEAGRRYQSAKELLVDLKNVRDRERREGAIQQAPARRPSKLGRKVVIPAVVVLVTAIALVIGLRIRIGRQPAAVAAENSLAVMYFENMADPGDSQRLGEIATNLLITDLSESQYIRVVSSQRLYDILKLLGREGEKRIDRAVATEVAEKAGARWMLLGSILRVTPHIEITTQLVEVASGDVEASQRIRGEPGEEMFSLVDRLTVEVKRDLSLPAGAEREPDPTVADVTTNSPEAYRSYIEGMDYRNKLYFPEAERSFRKALEHDSTFAMAYYQLVFVTSELGRGEEKELIAKAMEYSEKATRKERAYIRAIQALDAGDRKKGIEELKKIVSKYPEEKWALLWLGLLHDHHSDTMQEAIGYFTRAIEVDPLYKNAYNNLAYAYHAVGDFDKSIWAINEYISLAPEEANPYDSRGDLFAWSGKLDEAIESYEKALQIKPDFALSFGCLGHMYLFSRQYEKAEEYYRKLASDKEVHNRAKGRTFLALIPVYQGRFEEALAVLDAGISADLMEKFEGWHSVYKHVLKAVIYEEQRKLDLALREAKTSAEFHRKLFPDVVIGFDGFLAYHLAKQGRIGEAEEMAAAIGSRTELMDSTEVSYYMDLLGWIEYAQGNVDASIDLFEEVVRLNPSYYSGRYALGRAYLEAGRLGEAVAEFEKAMLRYDEDRILDTVAAVKAFYFLGVAYERSGWSKRAMEQYEAFLDIWKDADPGIDEIEDAKARLTRLKGPA